MVDKYEAKVFRTIHARKSNKISGFEENKEKAGASTKTDD